VSVDFDRLRERLRDAFGDGEQDDRDGRVEQVLQERITRLASRRLEVEERELVDEVIVLRRGGILLATPTWATREVRSVEVAGLPGATDVVKGIFQIRGRTFGLVDLAPFFGETSAIGHGQKTLVALVSGAPGDLGLRIDEILGPRRIHKDEIDEGLRQRALGFVSHVTTDLIHILDVDAVMASPEVRITDRRA
jgi:chemotaxis signal transduction protein